MFRNILQHHLRSDALKSSLAVWSTSARQLGSVSSSTSHHRISEACKQPVLPFGVPPGTGASIAGPQHQTPPSSLSTLLSRLSLSPEEAAATVEYRLPSKSPAIQTVILDPVATVSIPWDCPTGVSQDYVDVPSHQSIDIVIEEPKSENVISKKATNILQKRHRKMKRHQYKKWRKRNRFKLRAQKQRRRKKQRERWERHLSRFRFTDLKPSEGEEYLRKKQEKLNIYLRYLGVDVDDASSEKRVVEDGGEGKKKRRGSTCVIEGTGRMVPQPILPVGVPQR